MDYKTKRLASAKVAKKLGAALSAAALAAPSVMPLVQPMVALAAEQQVNIVVPKTGGGTDQTLAFMYDDTQASHTLTNNGKTITITNKAGYAIGAWEPSTANTNPVPALTTGMKSYTPTSCDSGHKIYIRTAAAITLDADGSDEVAAADVATNTAYNFGGQKFQIGEGVEVRVSDSGAIQAQCKPGYKDLTFGTQKQVQDTWTNVTGTGTVTVTATPESTTEQSISYYATKTSAVHTETVAGTSAGYVITNPAGEGGEVVIGWTISKTGTTPQSIGWTVDRAKGTTTIAASDEALKAVPYALYALPFSLTYDLGGGEFADEVEDIDTYVGDAETRTVTTSTPAKDYAEFQYWTVETSEGTFKVPAGTDLKDGVLTEKQKGDGSFETVSGRQIEVDGEKVSCTLDNLAKKDGSDLELEAVYAPKVDLVYKEDGAEVNPTGGNAGTTGVILNDENESKTLADTLAGDGDLLGWATVEGGSAITTVGELAEAVEDDASLVSSDGKVTLYAVRAEGTYGRISYVENHEIPTAAIAQGWSNSQSWDKSAEATTYVKASPIAAAKADAWFDRFSGWSTVASGEGGHTVELAAAGSTAMPAWLKQLAYQSGGATLYGVWEPVYQLQFVAKAADGAAANSTSALSDANYKAADELVIAQADASAAAGKTFAGWKTKSGKVFQKGDTVELAASDYDDKHVAELTAVFTDKDISYKVFFNAGGGKGTMAAIDAKTGDGGSLPANAFTRDGYEFDGWVSNTNRKLADGASRAVLDADATEGATVTLTAQWAAKYTVKYDKNASAATGATESTSAVKGTEGTLADNGFERSGYHFLGWVAEANKAKNPYELKESDYIASTNQTDKLAGATAKGTVTLYAVWALGDEEPEALTYSVVCNGTVYKYTVGVEAPLPAAMSEGEWMVQGGAPVKTKADLDALVAEDGDVLVLVQVARGWYRGDDGRWYYEEQLLGGVANKVGWLKDGGEWYWLQPSSGAMARDKWCQVDGKWYYFDSDGVMMRYRGLFWRGSWYWLKDQGEMAHSETINIGYGDYEYDADGRWIAYEKAKLA